MIEEKISRYDEMERRLNESQANEGLLAENRQLRESLSQFDGIDALFGELKNKGYLKQTGQNNFLVPQSATEHYDFLKEVHAEQRAALVTELQNKELARH